MVDVLPTVPTSASAQAFWAERNGDTLELYWSRTAQAHRQAIIGVLHTLSLFRSVLDLGCWAGTTLKTVQDTFPWVTLCGTEVNPLACDFARAHLPTAVIYHVGPYEFLRAQPDRAVDVIITCYTLAYFDRDGAHPILREAVRVARSAIIVAEPHVGAGSTVLRMAPVAEWGHDHHMQLASLLTESGRKGRADSYTLTPPVDCCNAVSVVRFHS